MKKRMLAIMAATIIILIYDFMQAVGYGPPPALKQDPTMELKPGQAAIDEAMLRFDIWHPTFSWPQYKSDMQVDQTAQATANFTHTCIVTIGTGAFSSWAELGAILIHELEGHCKQNLWLNSRLAAFDEELLNEMEVEAYQLSIDDWKRVGLTRKQVSRIILICSEYGTCHLSQQ